MERKIKTVKEFIKDGPPQFDVILRREKGESVQLSIHSENDEVKLDYVEMVYPEPGSEGLIRIVKRISDDAVFHTNDLVEVKEIGSCFIIGFNDDFIHCVVLDSLTQESGEEKKLNKIIVSINDIELHGDNFVADEEGIEGSGEDHWPELDSPIDEW